MWRARNGCAFGLRLTATDRGVGLTLSATEIAIDGAGAQSIAAGSHYLQLGPFPNSDTGGEVIFRRIGAPIRRMLGGIQDPSHCPCEMTDVAPSGRPDLAA
jgi:hypothetical protein